MKNAVGLMAIAHDKYSGVSLHRLPFDSAAVRQAMLSMSTLSLFFGSATNVFAIVRMMFETETLSDGMLLYNSCKNVFCSPVPTYCGGCQSRTILGYNRNNRRPAFARHPSRYQPCTEMEERPAATNTIHKTKKALIRLLQHTKSFQIASGGRLSKQIRYKNWKHQILPAKLCNSVESIVEFTPYSKSPHSVLTRAHYAILQ